MAVMIAGTNSGSGKSTVTLGVLAAMRQEGIKVQPFKAGPDFIDPGLHTHITGRRSYNLDLWMCGADYVCQSLYQHSVGADAAVIEGVMGLYDGGDRSSAALAREVGARVILVVDAYGMAESAGALLKGFNDYGQPIDGVIFNRVGSPRHYDRLRASVPKDIKTLGYLPRQAEFAIPERHLGLTVAEDEPLSAEAIDALASAVMEHIDINKIAEMARMPNQGSLTSPQQKKVDASDTRGSIRLGVARDRAFCFYYEDNLEMLRAEGLETVLFSPINDSALPGDIDAIYLGGGYPELHAGALKANAAMMAGIRDWVDTGRPLYAECGGLVYLSQGIKVDNEFHPMAGALPIRCELLDKRAALGYREATMVNNCIMGQTGQTLRGHEFRYSRVSNYETKDGVRYNVLALSQPGETSPAGDDAPEITSAQYKSTLASYTHLHLGSRTGAAEHMAKFIKGDF